VGADVYALAVGGVQVVEPGADLAVALALVSSFTGAALPADLVACGEVGLCGELRQVSQTGRRLAEAARLGFRRAVVPASAPEPPPGLEVLRASTLVEAISRAGLRLGPSGPGSGREGPSGPGSGKERPSGPGSGKERPSGPGSGKGNGKGGPEPVGFPRAVPA
jgi:hypothetical protein